MEYLDLDDKRIKHLDEMKILVDLVKYKRVGKKGTPNSELSELRYNIFLMLNNPTVKDKKWKPIKFSVVAGLTRGWTVQELYSIYRECIAFTKNPQALFWIKYKDFKKKYGEIIKKRSKKGGGIQQGLFC